MEIGTSSISLLQMNTTVFDSQTKQKYHIKQKTIINVESVLWTRFINRHPKVLNHSSLSKHLELCQEEHLVLEHESVILKG